MSWLSVSVLVIYIYIYLSLSLSLFLYIYICIYIYISGILGRQSPRGQFLKWQSFAEARAGAGYT